jgi:hypothetical protein
MYLKINHIIIYNIMDITNLVEENEKLKKEISELKEQLKNILMVILIKDIMKKIKKE